MTLKQLKKRLNPVAQKVGLYTAYRLDESEYVGAAHSAWSAKAQIEDSDYESPPNVAGIQLSAAKEHPHWDELYDLTYRKVDPDNPRWQWHIHLWLCGSEYKDVNVYYEIFSHYEMRPDFKKIDGEDTAEMLGRLQIHYRPEYGTDYYQGKADPVVQDLVND